MDKPLALTDYDLYVIVEVAKAYLEGTYKDHLTASALTMAFARALVEMDERSQPR